KPKALYTNPTLSNIKNFKIKLIAEELPTHLLLHLRNPKKYPNHFCPRCYSISKDYSHLLTCVSNHFTFNTELRRLLHQQNKYTKSFERYCMPKSFERIAIDAKSFEICATFRKISACISFEIFRNKFQ